jgi:uncharacterized cofD-like protein
VVSVADDGGSSGRLRRELGVAPPGDLRRCLAALSTDQGAFLKAFEHRFAAGGLEGHPMGNVLLAACFEALGGLEPGIDAVAGLLGVVGRVLPATCDPVVLLARTGQAVVRGQSTIMATSGIETLYHEPASPRIPDEVLRALAQADQILVGPGSLYTSVLAVAALPGIREVLERSRAQRVYVANLRPQPGETEAYDLARHLGALGGHGVAYDIVLADPAGLDVTSCVAGDLPDGVRLHLADLARPNGLAHDPTRLARHLSGLLG